MCLCVKYHKHTYVSFSFEQLASTSFHSAGFSRTWGPLMIAVGSWHLRQDSRLMLPVKRAATNSLSTSWAWLLSSTRVSPGRTLGEAPSLMFRVRSSVVHQAPLPSRVAVPVANTSLQLTDMLRAGAFNTAVMPRASSVRKAVVMERTAGAHTPEHLVSCRPSASLQVASLQVVLGWHTRPPLHWLGRKVLQGVTEEAMLAKRALASVVSQ
jgi:hypothetical protein